MSSSIQDIVLGIYVAYPFASPQDITDSIIDLIESTATVNVAVSQVTFPSETEVQRADFLSKRLPKRKEKDRERIQERISNVHFFKKLKGFYSFRPLDASFNNPIFLDGAQVNLPFPAIEIASVSKFPELRQRPLTGETQIKSYKTHGEVPITYESSLEFNTTAGSTKNIVASYYDVLNEVETAISKGIFLSFNNIYQLIKITKLYSTDEALITKIIGIASRDIGIRNSQLKCRCIEDLYKDDEKIPQEFKLSRSADTLPMDKLREHLQAIIFNEYKRLSDFAGANFINDSVSYEEYLDQINKYTNQADALFTAIL